MFHPLTPLTLPPQLPTIIKNDPNAHGLVPISRGQRASAPLAYGAVMWPDGVNIFIWRGGSLRLAITPWAGSNNEDRVGGGYISTQRCFKRRKVVFHRGREREIVKETWHFDRRLLLKRLFLKLGPIAPSATDLSIRGFQLHALHFKHSSKPLSNHGG